MQRIRGEGRGRRRGGAALIFGIVTALVLGTACSDDDSGGPAEGASGPVGITDALAEIENGSRYEQSDWGYVFLDAESGDTLVASNADKMFDPGSTMKIYSVATALRLYGPDYKFRTPVYQQGTVSDGALAGDLVLVASGDLSLGLREEPDGTLYFENLPELDQSYADTGLGGAVEPPGDPLAGLDEMAAQVRDSGITSVAGDVVIDDRLFENYDGFPDGLISPIWVNENLISVEVTPGDVGQPATIDWRPMTASYTVDNQVTTVESDQATPLAIEEPTPGHLVVTGKIAAGNTPTLVVQEVADPAAFARTAFIEALQRAGVTVTATPTGSNPDSRLPPTGSYQDADKVGEHVSAELAQYANLILKVSYNRAADLMTCLAAVKSGSTDCEQGLVEEGKTATDLGVPESSVFLFDGAGSDDHSRTTPAALATFLLGAASTAYGDALYDALPVLGESGTMANVLTDSPAAGHVQVKTGNRVVPGQSDLLILLGNSLAGYMETDNGRKVTFMIAVGNTPLSSADELFDVTDDQAKMAEIVWREL
jgi:serine-type D-Ala-D-Ala carboxypeptidase/endopeptidase (penicillin-binding protein 4)